MKKAEYIVIGKIMEAALAFNNAVEYSKHLEHHKDTTVGLWATDRPELIDDPKKLLFEITE